MSWRKIVGTMLFTFLILTFAFSNQQAFADSSESAQKETKDDETNLDTQLYLVFATNSVVDNGKLPAVLDSVIKQLRSSLPFKNYRLAATLINRVKNEGRLNLQWIGGPLLAASAANNSTPQLQRIPY